MKKVAAIYTGFALVEPGKRAFARILPDVKNISILDESIIAEVIAEGSMTQSVLRRLYRYCQSAVDSGADVILETCSSVGESVELLQPFFNIPIIRIDQAMIQAALDHGGSIGVLATVPTTLEPTLRLARKMAKEQGIKLEVISGLAMGAFEAISQGNMKEHDKLVTEKALSMRDCSTFLLAQGSMAHLEKPLSESVKKPVFTSLDRGLKALKMYL